MTDHNGHINQWIIEDAVFRAKYQEDPSRKGLYMPTGGTQKMIRLTEPIHIRQWGEDWYVDAGGYVNITDPNDIYVISGRDFADTYEVV